MTSQKLRGQNKIVMWWLSLGIIKTKNLSIRKRNIIVIPTLVLIKNCLRSAPTADRMVTSQLNASKNCKGIDTQANQII